MTNAHPSPNSTCSGAKGQLSRGFHAPEVLKIIAVPKRLSSEVAWLLGSRSTTTLCLVSHPKTKSNPEH
ncbi:hypothetical protein MPTK1_1g24990 [Marchantia polymorpha subsp. ruderalis]|uniref:Uncharacterized protein n=2 Tax=Marchantia polymorpha TaxID=3197 RepID=A0AAF6AU17_MARPO|nr:hypothetical protein MARPO_0061s0026 [Marchantia polymorpha]BBM99937.1 hypothetical protein Mp_1g24990 [Marchantia polymorpha subsp. ruderalis]|eukprot:PTQ36749.1 hypothetical protein MARPO_0061s0026 [Marchantia polymorpha]